MKSKVSNREKLDSSYHPFKSTDRKGREIGALIVVYTVTYVEAPETDHSWSSTAPGTYLELRNFATRNGIPYGSSHPAKLFATRELLDREVLRAQLDARAAVEGRNRTNLILYILRQALAEPEGLVPVRRP